MGRGLSPVLSCLSVASGKLGEYRGRPQRPQGFLALNRLAPEVAALAGGQAIEELAQQGHGAVLEAQTLAARLVRRGALDLAGHLCEQAGAPEEERRILPGVAGELFRVIGGLAQLPEVQPGHAPALVGRR